MALLLRLGHAEALWIGVPLLAIALSVIGVHLARSDEKEGAPSDHNVLAAVGRFGYKRRIFEVLLDVGQAMAAVSAAFLIRFDGDLPDPISNDLVRVFPILVTAKIVGLLASGAYAGIWKYVGVRDLVRLGSGAVLGSLLGVALIALWLRLGMLSRGALVLDGILFTGLVTGSRLSFRVLRTFLRSRPEAGARRVLLWGAGDTGAAMARGVIADGDHQMIPVGFIDDDAMKVGRSIHGLSVLGSSDKITELLEAGTADSVLVTSDRIPVERIWRVAAAIGEDRIRRMRLMFESVSLRPPPATEKADLDP
jgi:UDP-GlcNAc:undecaprenyl-phosphate GlcNAc-1-phosphate transferase